MSAGGSVFVSAEAGATFVELLDIVDTCYPTGRGHIVCDNLSAHDTDDVLDWFDEHPRWTRHFTPKHASWLNQIECMFSILEKRALRRGSFASLQELEEKIYAYMLWHNETGQPFEWSYRPKSWSQKPAQTSGSPTRLVGARREGGPGCPTAPAPSARWSLRRGSARCGQWNRGSSRAVEGRSRRVSEAKAQRCQRDSGGLPVAPVSACSGCSRGPGADVTPSWSGRT